ncbi:MAG: NAD-dependent epimerase/dehydratase family protein [Xanthomonadales bacterium]|nr:NAD-dependent epimerase/dehydratase family protein [Xanthomonadales bacterium]
MTIDTLVTGATGFIGGHLTRRLVERGRCVRILVRSPEQVTSTLRESCELVTGDLDDLQSLSKAVRGAKWIYHCAANVSTWSPWVSYRHVNVDGVSNLLETIRREGPDLSRLLHVSSADVYGFPKQPCSEECPLTGAGFGYGESKLQGEALVSRYGNEFGVPVTVVRPANVIGPGSQFISRIGQELNSGMMMTIDGGRSNAGLVYIDNLVEAMILAAESSTSVGECFNIRDDYDVSWKEFIERFRTIINGHGLVINLPFPVAELLARGFESSSRLLRLKKEPLLHRLLIRIFGRTCGHDATKIRQLCGAVTGIGFEEAMQRSCAWFLQSGNAG